METMVQNFYTYFYYIVSKLACVTIPVQGIKEENNLDTGIGISYVTNQEIS
jgi:hypothetical protein